MRKAERRHPAAKTQPSRTGNAGVYQLKVTLFGVEPPVWRRVQVNAGTTLDLLHAVVQAAMGWTNSHLHQFEANGVRYSSRRSDLEGTKDESKVTLEQVAGDEGSRFSYEYDFGDGWLHEIRVEKISSAGGLYLTHPVCLAGARACPPEDCGGVGGYEGFLEAIRDPEHPEHRDMLDWIGGDFDPEEFDIAAVNRELKRLR
jgi:hypothetical protein